jgi:diguanylate cyclase (GGDEF)-like protein
VTVSIAGVNVTEALRLLRQAGYPDPRASEMDETVILQRTIDDLCTLSLLDGLTGLANARHFKTALERETERAERTGESCALLLLDIDHFKIINDTHGHPAGDRVLQAIAKVLARNLRPMDTVARYGGEEFAVVLPNSLLGYAIHVAERLRTRIAIEPIGVLPYKSVQVTASIGIACSLPWARLEPGALLETADRNLYEAKTHGRNRVWSVSDPSAALSPDERLELFNLPG